MDEFPAAPWPASLKVSSALVTILVLAVGFGAVRVIPPRGPEHVVGTAVAVALPFMLLASVLFVVTGFAIDHRALAVRRMLWSTRVDLAGLRHVWREPDALRGARRLYGNAGLYSFSGVYRNRKLGRFRLFGTDPACAVVLVSASGTFVVTPADPEAFIRRVQVLFPGARGNPSEEGHSTPDRHIHPIS